MDLIQHTITFAAKNSTGSNKPEAPSKRIGTLSVGILKRKIIRDRRGRKRRTRDEYESALVTGGGKGMTGVAARQMLSKELGGGLKQSSIPLTQEKLRKLISIFKSKK